MATKKRRRKPKPITRKAARAAQQVLNRLYQRARPQGRDIPADYEQIEPDRGRDI